MPASSTGARTTVVVVTWRGHGLIGRCLGALVAQTRPHQLLVIDNASTDGTAGEIAEHRCRALRMTSNVGYAGALAAALPLVDTPFMAWLNDDAQPEPGWLAALEQALDEDATAAAAASVLHAGDGAVISTGVVLTRIGYGADSTGTAPFGFCGGAALLRTEVLRAAGGVPEELFCYYEDTDTSWRLRLAGYRVRGGAGAPGSPDRGAAGPGQPRRGRLGTARHSDLPPLERAEPAAGAAALRPCSGGSCPAGSIRRVDPATAVAPEPSRGAQLRDWAAAASAGRGGGSAAENPARQAPDRPARHRQPRHGVVGLGRSVLKQLSI
jgi:hypothetical protein